MRGQAMVLVTGVAGFIGFHTAKKLLDRGDRVVGGDNVDSYYHPQLKEARLRVLTPYPRFSFERLDISDAAHVNALFERHSFRGVVHLAAQAGVRYSLINPHAYTNSNIEGFMNILEGCRQAKIEHLVYASSS